MYHEVQKIRRTAATLFALTVAVAIGSVAFTLPAHANQDDADPVLLEVKFDEGLAIRGSDDNLRSQRGQSLGRVESVLEQYGATTVEPFVSPEAADRLSEMAADGVARTGDPVPDMTSWYTVAMPADTEADQAQAALQELSEVEYAELAPEPAPPPQPDTPDFTGMQTYFEPATQNGIDADFTRADSQMRGDGIRVVDLEYSWNASHEDLQLGSSSDLGAGQFPQEPQWVDHGTAVFGELVALENSYGVTGGVPDAEMYGISPYEMLTSGRVYRPGAALTFLATLEESPGNPFLRPGDVVLLEQQTGSPLPEEDCVVPSQCYAPIEWIVSVHNAVQLLSSQGVIVVTAGGNGYNSTDHPAYTRNGVAWFGPNNHSGSIMVGAGNSANRERLNFSNHGSRFDLQGWGNQITTTGYCTLYCENDDIRYSQTFGGTSGATPIVTTAVVAIQSYLDATGQTAWTAQQVVNLLTTTGQPQGSSDPPAENIGPLPDLQAAMTSIDD